MASPVSPIASVWFFINSKGEQEGPHSESEMLQSLMIGKLNLNSLVWTAGQGEWKSAAEFQHFRDYMLGYGRLATAVGQWLYIKHSGETVGPIAIEQLKTEFEAGELDGMSLVWTAGMSEWKPMGTIALLKESFSIESSMEHENSKVLNEDIFKPEMMVFEPEEQPVLDEESSQALAMSRKRDEGAKRFETDTGVRCIWDEDEQAWVEAGSEDEDVFEEEEDEKPFWKSKLEKKKEAQKVKNAKESEGSEQKTADKTQNDEKTSELEGNENGKNSKFKKNRKKKRDNWSKEGSGKWIYINGLPPDTTEEELRDHFAKAGVIATDPITQAPRLKLYRDESGFAKGDASICFVMEESVDLALQVLDDSQLRSGVYIKVSRAVFEQKGSQLDSTKRLKLTDARVKVARAAAKQALSWNESDDSGIVKGGLKIVVIENMFDPVDFVEDPEFGEDLEADLALECQKLGPLDKITVFSRNPIGPVVVKFGTAFAAEECIKKMEGRWFGQRKLKCHYWDGITNYNVKEEESKEEQRLQEFGDWLEQQELPEEMRLKTE